MVLYPTVADSIVEFPINTEICMKSFLGIVFQSAIIAEIISNMSNQIMV